MGQNILFATLQDTPAIARALDSDLRRKILGLLEKGDMNIKQLCDALDIPQSTCTMNVQILEKASLIETRQVPAETKGSQKICSIRYEKIILPLVSKNEYEDSRAIETEMPIGLFNDYSVTAPCGLVSAAEVIGFYDSVVSFLNPARAGAELIWFSSGYLEYRFPKNFKAGAEIEAIEFSAELCSEYPGHNDEWPSDITVWINGRDLGSWTAPGDMGGRRGLLTPKWWNTNDSQSGFLKTWTVDQRGSWMDGGQLSKVTVQDLAVHSYDSIVLRIGVKEDAKNRGGINIFGSKFGNFPQDIRLTVRLG
ncbi:ArsR/SmtB family transcription factor [Breznakiella homolactica]|uniref:Helix-turn-helix domain-containing protein n=1 Tax=Breznakiella homolactica TaxID=2798577 RepID=A0A7T7XMQ4_9SPIR|nr:helix-turn-helix domain-containing protein [Breznakiella homolactica]QQO09113.1 helix-turn-helix domain-containing protein [Breznakiella homolactica]